MRLITILSLILNIFFINSQVSIITTNYTQNFGTTTVSSWNNNSTFLGWYINDVTEFQGDINITGTAPTNVGGVYIYRCSSGVDRKLGTRASGGTGTIHYGLRIRNNTGTTINSITVTYTAYQLSLAENNNNTNTNTFSYRVVSSPSTITDLTTGIYTNVTTLNYTAPINHGGPGNTTQINGIPCTTSSLIASCIPVLIQNNGEIMLRWTDIDNSANDHHLAIDDVQILFHFDNICTITLPIELLSFTGNYNNSTDYNEIKWSTASEINNDRFDLYSSVNGIDWELIGSMDGAGNSTTQQYYTYNHRTDSELTYYKLKQVDYDGEYKYSDIISVYKENKIISVRYFDMVGKELPYEPTNGLFFKIIQYSNQIEYKTMFK